MRGLKCGLNYGSVWPKRRENDNLAMSIRLKAMGPASPHGQDKPSKGTTDDNKCTVVRINAKQRFNIN